MFEAALVGIKRQYWAMMRGLRDKKSVNKREGWTLHVEGAAAELAGCIALGIPWPATVNTGKAPDAGKWLEFRRSIEAWYDLRIRDGDNPDLIYVLVTGQIPNFLVVGWIKGRDGMIQKNRTDPNGRGEAWFVPQSDLQDIYKLRGYAARGEKPGERKPTSRIVARCHKHGEYEGDGNCPGCELERMGA